MTGFRITLCLTVFTLAALCIGMGEPASPQYTIADLGTLGGDSSYAAGLNDAGQVVGQSRTTPGQPLAHAFLWDHGRMSDLGTLGGPYSWANAINLTGQVVGASWLARSSDAHAFLWDEHGMTDLGTLDNGKGYSQAIDINASGQIVGVTSVVGASLLQPFLWENGKMRNLGTGGALAGGAG